MLRPRKLTFYKMMLAGYLSAKAYRALKPKSQICELSFSDCFEFEPEICNELKKIFEEDDLRDSLYCLENIEESINIEWGNIDNLLSLCTNNSNGEHLNVIHVIGEKTFVQEYVFCSYDSFKNLNYVTDDNFAILNQVRNEFAALYKNYLKTGTLPEKLLSHHTPKSYTDVISDETFIVSEPFGDYSVTSGSGFNRRNNFVIDDDALGINNRDCKKYVLYLYSLNSEQFEKFQDFLINVISNCSVRLYNAIKALGYRNFIVNFLFADDNKFFQIRNFGRKSLVEFNSIRPQIISFVVNEYNGANTEKIEEEIQKEQDIKKYQSLTLKEKVGEIQYTLLTNMLKVLMSEVSVRTQNGINNYKGDFIEDFVHKSNNVRKIKHIGKKSEKELNSIISQLRETIDNLERRELTKEEIFWIEKSTEYDSLIDDYCHNYYQNKGHLPMFRLLKNCITSLLKERHIKILDSVISLLSDENGKEIEEVAKEHNLTRERIRQICLKTINNLSQMQDPEESNTPIYHKLLSQADDWAYIKDVLCEKELWSIDEISVIYESEECSINKEFVLVILSVIFPKHFSIIGKTPLSISSRSNGWFGTYLISKRLSDSFDFNVMIDIVNDYEESHTEPITLTIQELLMDTFFSAWKEYDFSIETELEQLVGKILIDELGIIPDLDLNYTLVGKKEENPADILYNLLVNAGDPLSIDELFEQICITMPNKYKSASSLRAIITRDPRLCLLGVNNMVALSEWNHIKTGSIRELIAAYLAEFDSPQHIKDIVAHILNLRETSERSISATMSSGDQFVKFAGGYYGLADKTYSDFFSLSEAERYSRKRINDFEAFLKDNLRFPFCPSNDKEEESLYQWWGRLKRNKEISDFLKQEIERIESTYSNLARNRSDFQWFDHCIRYREFVHANGRQPLERNPIEANLAKWFSKTLNDVADGRLSSLREKEFIKLCKSL